MSEPRHDVFISYSSKDKTTADAICALLERRGIRCWIAPRDILPGQEWAQGIIQGIQGSRLLVLVFSGNANLSPQVRREVERAAHNELPIIPFRIEDVPPHQTLEFFISSPHWIDALTPPLEAHIGKLADAVARLLDIVPPTDSQSAAKTVPIPTTPEYTLPTASLRVERRPQMSMLLATFEVLWNGQSIGQLPANRSIDVRLPPGSGEFRLRARVGDSGFALTDPLVLDLAEDRLTTVRLRSGLNLNGKPPMNFWVDADLEPQKRLWALA